jgi:hypothetical protein
LGDRLPSPLFSIDCDSDGRFINVQFLDTASRTRSSSPDPGPTR